MGVKQEASRGRPGGRAEAEPGNSRGRPWGRVEVEPGISGGGPRGRAEVKPGNSGTWDCDPAGRGTGTGDGCGDPAGAVLVSYSVLF